MHVSSDCLTDCLTDCGSRRRSLLSFFRSFVLSSFRSFCLSVCVVVCRRRSSSPFIVGRLSFVVRRRQSSSLSSWVFDVGVVWRRRCRCCCVSAFVINLLAPRNAILRSFARPSARSFFAPACVCLFWVARTAEATVAEGYSFQRCVCDLMMANGRGVGM